VNPKGATDVGKLVRDRIPDLIRRSGREPVVRVLSQDEYLASLDQKLLEEAGELCAADRENRLEEAADVYEVLKAIATTLDLTMADVAAKADQKRHARGGFDARLWLE
jgi:predicted house-cleaning noncanonical NTP pyrophosphatase (MazG superfamily)